MLIHSAVTHLATAQAIPKPDYVTHLPREVELPVQATVRGVGRIDWWFRGNLTVFSHNLG